MSYRQHFNYDVMKLVELSRNDTSLVTVEATVVTGFEWLAMDECVEKFKPIHICKAKGRIYFNIPVESFSKVMDLRAVDNVFLVNDAFEKIELYKDKEKDIAVIQGLVDKINWKRTLTTWAELTKFSGILFPPLKKSTDEFSENIDEIVLDEKYDNLSEKKVIADITLDKEILFDPLKKRPDTANSHISSSSEDSFYSIEDVKSITEVPVPEEYNLGFEEKAVDTVENIKKNVDERILKFRATCNRTGEHCFTSMEAAAAFGGTLHDKFNWSVNLDNFNLNVILNINSDKCYFCSAITLKSLHRRNITHFGYTTLRSTMCYSMIRLAEPTTGEIIIDPLCGGGSIPIEGALGFQNTFHICGDNNEKAINRTCANINHITKTQPLLIDPLKWSAKTLPLRDQCVDIFVTDLPFGKRSGKKSDNLKLYKNVLTEMARVTRCGTGRAVLLSNDKTSLLKAIESNSTYWRKINNFAVNQGGLFSSVFLLLRTAKPFI